MSNLELLLASITAQYDIPQLYSGRSHLLVLLFSCAQPEARPLGLQGSLELEWALTRITNYLAPSISSVVSFSTSFVKEEIWSVKDEN